MIHDGPVTTLIFLLRLSLAPRLGITYTSRRSSARLALPLLMPRVRLARNVEVAVVPLPGLPPDNLSKSPVSKPSHPVQKRAISARRLRGRRRYLTLQCSHLFFTELCTFIPLTCAITPPATEPSLRRAIATAGAVLGARLSAGRAMGRRERAPKARSSEVLIVDFGSRGRG